MDKNFINTLLDAAGDITLNYFNSDNLHIETKADDSPVSKADKDAETVIRGLIKQSYPEHGIIGEEFGCENEGAEYTWIIDPIDGTRAFINGIDTFANMVCLLHNDKPILSGIGFPAKSQRYIAYDNKTFVNEIETTVGVHNLSDCKVSYSLSEMFTADEFKTVEKITAFTQGAKVGGDAYNYCRMTAGDNLIVMESDLKPYDFLPLVPIIKNAGGYIADWNGNELTLQSGNQVIATPFEMNELVGVINNG
ncbi:MAG: inositol monophosphatase family protein [Alphaproteobacteria bacterium]